MGACVKRVAGGGILVGVMIGYLDMTDVDMCPTVRAPGTVAFCRRASRGWWRKHGRVDELGRGWWGRREG